MAVPGETGAVSPAQRLAPASRPDAPPVILLTTTLRWPFAARLAMDFAQAGCRVEALCPREHPLSLVGGVSRLHRHSVLNPLRALRAAIAAAQPALVVPCDDEAAIHLDALHRASAGKRTRQDLCALIERSLGAPEACTLAATREAMMNMAAQLGIRHPGTALITRQEDLAGWLERNGYPAVLKQDRSWGGQGVAIVRTWAEAQQAFIRLSAPRSFFNAAARMLLDRDATLLRNRITGPDPAVSVQKFVGGAAANRAVACWRGDVLAGTSLEAVEVQDATGPATVVRVIENAGMEQAARTLVEHFGLSGLWGFDFVLGAHGPCLIEVNPRATPACALPAGHGLPAALAEVLNDGGHAVARHGDAPRVIALFPGEWRREPDSVHLRSAWHDVPWSEPALVQDCLAAPWAERGWVARLWARLRTPKSTAPAAIQAAASRR